MNLALVDPFVLALDYPDSLTSRQRMSFFNLIIMMSNIFANPFVSMNQFTDCPEHIGSGHAATIRFNRKGDYLASGRV